MKKTTPEDIEFTFSECGLIPAIVQDSSTEKVLMLAYMNRESLQKTLDTGAAWFWSRSRGKLWMKGESSGHVQKVKEIRYDCDGDALLLLVEPLGPACHTGHKSCFYRTLTGPDASHLPREHDDFLEKLREVIRSRLKERPQGSYVAALAGRGEDRIIQKVGEEATELVIALKNKDGREIVLETADLIFHTLLALEWAEVPWSDIIDELRSRHAGPGDEHETVNG